MKSALNFSRLVGNVQNVPATLSLPRRRHYSDVNEESCVVALQCNWIVCSVSRVFASLVFACRKSGPGILAIRKYRFLSNLHRSSLSWSDFSWYLVFFSWVLPIFFLKDTFFFTFTSLNILIWCSFSKKHYKFYVWHQRYVGGRDTDAPLRFSAGHICSNAVISRAICVLNVKTLLIQLNKVIINGENICMFRW